MSNYEDMIKNVHRRIDEYEAKQRAKKAMIKKEIAMITPVCAAAGISIGLWKFGTLNFHNDRLISNTVDSANFNVVPSADNDISTDNHRGNSNNSAEIISQYISAAETTIYHLKDSSESMTENIRTNSASVEMNAPATDNISTSALCTSVYHNNDSQVVTESPSLHTDDSVKQTTPPVQQTTPAAQQTILTATQTTHDNSQGNSLTEPPHPQTGLIQYVSFSRDYPYYDNISSLLSKANQVFSGRVVDISFEMLNMRTMQPLKDGDDLQWAMIYTIYEIEAEKVYAGSPSSVKLRIEGGIPDNYEQEQIALLGDNRIPVMKDIPAISLGMKYLFVLYHADGAVYSSVLNPMQSIYIEDEINTGGFSSTDIISCFS